MVRRQNDFFGPIPHGFRVNEVAVVVVNDKNVRVTTDGRNKGTAGRVRVDLAGGGLAVGATGHFVTTDAPFTNKRAAIPGISAQLPDGGTINSTHTCSLDLPFLPAAAREAHISIGLLCDHGCTAFFNASTVSACSVRGGAAAAGAKGVVAITAAALPA